MRSGKGGVPKSCRTCALWGRCPDRSRDYPCALWRPAKGPNREREERTGPRFPS